MGQAGVKVAGMLIALALAGCAPSAPPGLSLAPAAPATPAPAAIVPPVPRPTPDQCGSDELAGLVGRPTAAIPIPVEPGRRRVICTTCPRGPEVVPSRQTIEFDAATGLVTAAGCG